MKIRKLAKYWGPPVVWAVIIFFFSSLPSVETIEIYWQDFIIKKTAHMIEYALLATLLYRALIASGKNKKQAFTWSFFITLFYAATDEFHQSFTPGRESRVRDVVIDAVGAGLALYSIKVFLPKASKRVKYLFGKLEIK